MDGNAILVAEGVRKVYRSGAEDVVALHDLDLEVPRGQFVAVMGPSGSGKTPLLNCLSSLDEIDRGRVVVDGKSIHELSGGEQQRVAVARALAGTPSVVWADEPTGNLDSEMAHAVMELLAELHAEGLSIVLVTHDRTVASYADRLLTVRDGRLVGDEPLGTALEPELVAAV